MPIRMPLAALAIVALPLGGCHHTSGGTAGGSCAFVVAYDGRDYIDAGRATSDGRDAPVARGERLGRATDVFCDDMPGDGESPPPPEKDHYVVYGVVGRDPADLIWVEDPDDGEFTELMKPVDLSAD